MDNTTPIVEEETSNTECIESSNNEKRSSENASEHAANVHDHHYLSPRIGLEFDSLEDVKNFYKAFAKEEGFGIRTRSTKPNLCILVCSNAGHHVPNSNVKEVSNTITRKRKKRCSTSRTDCNASLVVSKARKRHKWAIISFNNVHNHNMVSPKSVNYLRCHKKLSLIAKNLVEFLYL